MDQTIKEKEIPVTVLMCVYNASAFLREAMDSILNQTFCDFEFLIINDGSTDQTLNIIEDYTDKRIRIINNTKNQGLIYSLNKGLSLSKGKYIVRMDADDVCELKRIEKQCAFMENNGDIDICGTYIQILGTNEIRKPPTNYKNCWFELLHQNIITHPSVVIRKSSLLKNNISYSEKHPHAEDYDLWVRCSMKKMKIVNLSEILLQYRLHQNQISSQYLSKQSFAANEIRMAYIRYCWPEILPKNLDEINNLFSGKYQQMSELRLFHENIIRNKIHKYGRCNGHRLDKFVMNFLDEQMLNWVLSDNMMLEKGDFYFIVLNKFFWLKLSLRKKIRFLWRCKVSARNKQ